jgi:hypothetical protein
LNRRIATSPHRHASTLANFFWIALRIKAAITTAITTTITHLHHHRQ